MLPWMLMSPSTSSAGLRRCLAEGRVGGDEEGDADLGLDLVAQQVDDLDVEVGGVEVAGRCRSALLLACR